MMKSIKCAFCGSENVSKKQTEKSSVLPNGTAFKFMSEAISCADCGTITDVEGADDKAFLAAYEVALNAG